jgi:hypothetical protein
MPPPGGPAAINGFLYQILQHLGWIANVKLTGCIVDGVLASDACLVLEPSNGGDARAESAAYFVVEQYKSRRDGTWSVNTIIDEVLKDLRKAVPESVNRKAIYRFVTDGRPGKLAMFKAFLAAVRSATQFEDLDDVQTYSFGKGLPVTYGNLFNYIVERVRPAGQSAGGSDRTAVFHLLSRFEMVFESKAETVKKATEDILRNYVPDLGDERGVRERLVGILVEELAKGEACFDSENIDNLFKRVELDPDRLRKLAGLAETMGEVARDRLYRMKYRSETDVRKVPEWPLDKPVLLISGESGHGKTWLLGRLVSQLVERRELVSLNSSICDSRAQLLCAANDIWQVGLNGATQKTLEALTIHYREMKPNVSMPWLTIAVDDVQDPSLARELVRNDWKRLGLRLVMTVPNWISLSLELGDSESVHVQTVGRFSISELDEFLTREDRSYTDLPADLKELLRLPILAGLYTALPYDSFAVAPRSEYEIFEQFWRRIKIRSQLGDDGILFAMAARVVNDQLYPLPRTAWPDIGVVAEAPIMRLESTGWIQCLEGGFVSFAHDRLLNWALAMHLAQEVKQELRSVASVTALLVKTTDLASMQSISRLGYVPMDLLWILLADTNNLTMVMQLIETLNATGVYGHDGVDLYGELLPTLGIRAVPILFKTLDRFADDDDYQIGFIAKGLTSIAIQEDVDLSTDVALLLHSPLIKKQKIAISILTAVPDAHCLNRLWELHQQRCSALEARGGSFSIREYQASNAALRACIELDPNWLEQRITNAAAQSQDVSELAYLLNNLSHPNARKIWLETRTILFARIRPDKPRSLLYCVGRFQDSTEIDFVLGCLKRQEDHASGAALATLILLDPDLAIARFMDVEEFDRYASRNNWLPLLLHLRSAGTRTQMVDYARNSPSGYKLIEELFAERANDVSKEMLKLYLCSFEVEIRESLDVLCNEDSKWLSRSLDFLASIARLELTQVIEQERDGQLENMLSTIACSRIAKLGRAHDHILASLKRVLMLIGGDGNKNFITAALTAPHYWGRYDAFRCAYMYPNANLIANLGVSACRVTPQDADATARNEAVWEKYDAFIALAALEADEALVEAIWNSETQHVPDVIAELRNPKRPMSKEFTRRAYTTLSMYEKSSEQCLQKAILIAWLSADTDFILPVRKVFADSNPGSLTARYACIALTQLGDRSNALADLASSLFVSEEGKYCGINALVANGEYGLNILKGFLRGREIATWNQVDVEILDALYRALPTRQFAVESAASYCLEGQALFPPYEIAAEANSAKLREKIIHDAFAGHSHGETVSLQAIRGLAKFDSNRAIRAAESGLRTSPAIERDLCKIIARLAPNGAAEKLLNAAVSIERKSLCPAIGRTLRRLDQVSYISKLEKLIQHADRDIRAVAAELSGWLSSGAMNAKLEIVLSNETEEPVRRAILAAFDLQKREAMLLEIFVEFKQTNAERRWPILLTILEVGDPYLLTQRDDPLWIGAILNDAPYAYTYHADKTLADRKRKEK